MKQTDRVDHIESVLVKHLEESGAIRTDIAWLKKAYWTLTAAMIAAVAAQIFHPGASNVRQQSLPEVQQITSNDSR